MSEIIQIDSTFGAKPNLSFSPVPAPSGFSVEVIEPGSGPIVQAGSSVSVNYLGQIFGGKVFDNSFDRGQPFSFRVGAGQVISGWDRGLENQTVGSRLLLTIPPSHGYGAMGVPQAGIGGADTLIFVVDVVSVGQ